MKYVLIDEIKNGDIWTREYENEEEAIKKGIEEWNSLSDYDKKRREFFGVILSKNPDVESSEHLDGWIIFQKA